MGKGERFFGLTDKASNAIKGKQNLGAGSHVKQFVPCPEKEKQNIV